ncbi:hypothetical protein ACFVZR_15015 [Streptomyces sp. NPDC058316]|uniref:hypothetical protein n=1 Tax=unclassified Streptomyces TaxID=2593676 RepID=UPI0036E46C31
MQIADFFQELWAPSFGTPRGSVRDFLAPAPYEDAQQITEYLLGGHRIFSVMGSSEDVLGSGKTMLGGDSTFSDGDWIWRADLWFYVRTHRVELPEEFLARIRQHDYLVPAENETQMMEIAKYVDANL